MNEELEKRKKDLRDRLESELYVERYDTFKESVQLINQALEFFKIDHNYTYDEFCQDFTEECMKYMDEHPKSDMQDPRQMMLSVFPIVMSIIDRSKEKYGFKNDKLDSENTEQKV
jgi:Mg-chelatase subunit ChlI